MSDITLFNSNFEAKGNLKLEVSLDPQEINIAAVHQVVKAILAGRRQGTAATKTKAMVSGGGKKPFKQKGTGNARQGSKRSPLMPGGGTVFGPVPRSYEQKVNKKLMAKAIHSILADKFQAGKLLVVEKLPAISKTKEVSKLLAGKGLVSTLIVTTASDSSLLLAARNLERAKAVPVEGFSVYDAVKYENLVIEKDAFVKLSKKGE